MLHECRGPHAVTSSRSLHWPNHEHRHEPPAATISHGTQKHLCSDSHGLGAKHPCETLRGMCVNIVCCLCRSCGGSWKVRRTLLPH
jgi:hypothetical protein